MSYTKKKQGFTLIEIAIVIIIIGLLAGGVLKGLEILKDTRIQKTVDQIRSLQSAWFSYISRYQQLPGDDSQATQYLEQNPTNGSGDGTLSDAEKPNVWQHLHLSGIVQGSGITPASTPWGNRFEFSYNDRQKQHLLCILDLLGSTASILDRKIDDGIANQGSVFDVLKVANSYDAQNTYTFCARL